jgi:hypothetical protein
VRAAAPGCALLALLLAAGCAGPPAPTEPPCALAGQTPKLVLHLFFGRDIPGREPLTEAEWDAFAAETVTPQFPEGFTSFDGAGQWRDPRSRAISRERTKIVLVAVEPTADLAARLAAVSDAYRARYDQVSVGVIAERGCGAF